MATKALEIETKVLKKLFFRNGDLAKLHENLLEQARANFSYCKKFFSRKYRNSTEWMQMLTKEEMAVLKRANAEMIEIGMLLKGFRDRYRFYYLQLALRVDLF